MNKERKIKIKEKTRAEERGQTEEEIKCVVEKFNGAIFMDSPGVGEGPAEVALGTEEGAREVLQLYYCRSFKLDRQTNKCLNCELSSLSPF